MRGCLARLAALAFGLLLAWLLLEGLLRLMPGLLPAQVQKVTGRQPRSQAGLDRFYQQWKAVQVPDPYLGFRYAPNLDVVLEGHPDFIYRLRTNSRGLRNLRAAGPVDALLIGDSFAFGYGVNEEDSWEARLQAMTGLEFVNFGVSGFGPLRELRLLQRDGLALQPKLVVWQFFKNDFFDASNFQRWLASGHPDFIAWEAEVYHAPSAAPQGSGLSWQIRSWLYRHVITYELVKYALGLGAYADRSQRPLTVTVDGTPLYLEQTLNREWADFTRPDIEQGWHATQQALLQARDLAQAAGAQFVVVMAPSKEETYWRLMAPKVDDPQGFHMRLNSQRLAEFCQQEGLTCLDLYDSFAEAAQAGEVLYFSHDAHWNQAGHALAAQTVRDFLASQGLLSQ